MSGSVVQLEPLKKELRDISEDLSNHRINFDEASDGVQKTEIQEKIDHAEKSQTELKEKFQITSFSTSRRSSPG
jgi:hypothetical protein